MLFIGFGEDNVVPPKATMRDERKYDDSVSITEYKEFDGRPHSHGARVKSVDFANETAAPPGLTVAEHAAADAAAGGGSGPGLIDRTPCRHAARRGAWVGPIGRCRPTSHRERVPWWLLTGGFCITLA